MFQGRGNVELVIQEQRHFRECLTRKQGFDARPGCAVGWMTLALLNAGLAQSKNRSGLF